MKRMAMIFLFALMLPATALYGANEIYLDAVTGLIPPNGLAVDQNVTFHFRYIYDGGLGGSISGSTNGFRLYSPSASWNSFTGAIVWGGWTSAFVSGSFARVNPPSGAIHQSGADTLGFFGADMGGSGGGVAPGFNQITFTITTYFPASEAGKLVALDTAWFNNCGDWMWTRDGWTGIAPAWGGGPFADNFNIYGLDGYVFGIGGAASCCQGLSGNVDGGTDDEPNIGDVTYLVAYAFRGGPEPPCIDEADCNGDASVDIADVTYLVKFAFRGGPDPVACP